MIGLCNINRENKEIRDINLSQVTIKDSYQVNSFNKEIDYLKAFDLDKLVAGFLETKGLTPKAQKYSGWEDTEIKGHTLGHYLTAVSQAYGSTQDAELLQRLDYILGELKNAQLENGYLSAFEESLFDNVENKKPAWVPWYTMHKIISGLIQVYRHTKHQVAWDIVTRLGEWVYQRSSRWTEEVHSRVLSVEYGGMNDCLYELYKIHPNEHYLVAASKFDEIKLFEKIVQGHDILNGLHANTAIPKFLGALNRYRVLGESEHFYLEAAIKFWDMVVTHHSYVTGGNSEWEHFGMPDILDAERTNCTCETCNTYNMLKLSHELFKITGEKKYADFYENTFINAILSSQNPDTGMTTYFQPMATGYFKVYSTPFDKFWCCTGTGMENFTKLGSSIYFIKEQTLYVNQYVSSVVSIEDGNMVVTQESDIPNLSKVKFRVDSTGQDCYLDMRFRIPDWANGPVDVWINGKEVMPNKCKGYLSVARQWDNGDVIELNLPCGVTVSSLPDNPKAIAFKYGPIVLSAGLGTEDMQISSTGVMVNIPTKNMPIKDFIVIPELEIHEWIGGIQDNLVREEGRLAFKLKHTDEDHHLIFIPHYMQHKERYGIYWNLVKPNSPELKQLLLQKVEKDKLEEMTIDSILIGNDQYELEHEIQGEQTEAGNFDNLNYRMVQEKGWFSYKMKVDNKEINILQTKYHSRLSGSTVQIYVNNIMIAKETIKPIEPFGIYTKSYCIPLELTQNHNQVTVKFVAEEKEFKGLFDRLIMVRDLDK